MVANNHSFENNFEILDVDRNSQEITLLESFEINQHENSDNLLDNQTNPYKLPLINLVIC